jgi:peptidyl-tRNA hydrolase
MIGKGLRGLNQVIVVRKDIDWKDAKLAAQVAHVSVMAIERARYITGLAEAMVYFRTGENRI